jgi:tRNA-dihydrouridine synthase B
MPGASTTVEALTGQEAWRCPWPRDSRPLMLAPMQGVTNRGFRALMIERVRPDVVWTEFVRVQGKGARRVRAGDLHEVTTEQEVPLVVQVIGADPRALVEAALQLQEFGVQHLNLNLGCPYGRMGAKRSGGGLLEDPSALPALLQALRQAVCGSLSVKLRAGFRDPEEIFSLLPMFSGQGIDFLVLHPRTVLQRYQGTADHDITAQVRQQTDIPVIANGDIRSADQGLATLHQTGANGLMLGRGAIADPWLFARLRGVPGPHPGPGSWLPDLFARYKELFSGEQQVLAKMKEILCFLDSPELAHTIKRLRKAKSLPAFKTCLAELPSHD